MAIYPKTTWWYELKNTKNWVSDKESLSLKLSFLLILCEEMLLIEYCLQGRGIQISFQTTEIFVLFQCLWWQLWSRGWWWPWMRVWPAACYTQWENILKMKSSCQCSAHYWWWFQPVVGHLVHSLRNMNLFLLFETNPRYNVELVTWLRGVDVCG